MIVVGKNGRRRTVTTLEEVDAGADEMFAHLTDDEKLLVSVLGEELAGEEEGGWEDELEGHIYHTKPVSMEQFIEDPYYLGESCTTIYPEVKRDLISLFDRPYREAVFTGSIGFGKTYSSSIAICRIIYEMSCMISPQKTLGMSSGSELAIPLISKNLTLARQVMKSAIDDKIKESPYFMTLFAPRFRNEFTLFPDNIRVMIGSYASERILGTTIVSCFCDECLTEKSVVKTYEDDKIVPRTIGDLMKVVSSDDSSVKMVCLDHEDGKIKSGWWRIRESSVQSLVGIRTPSGYIEASLEHPFLTKQGGWLVYKYAKDVRVGDFIVREKHNATKGAKTEQRGKKENFECCKKKDGRKESILWKESHRGVKEQDGRVSYGARKRSCVRRDEKETKRGFDKKSVFRRDKEKNERVSKEEVIGSRDEEKIIRGNKACNRGRSTSSKSSSVKRGGESSFWEEGVRAERMRVVDLPGDLQLERVVSVERQGSEKTYSVCTEYNTFIADGFLVHNTNFPPKRKGQQITTSFGQKTRAYHFDVVEKIYRSIVRRIKSRFQKVGGGFPGMIILSSSAATNESFTERKIRESREDPDIFIRDHTKWTVKPEDFRGEYFYVLCSTTSSVKSRILNEEEYESITDDFLEANDAFVLDVPVDFREDFKADMEDSLRDIAGFPTEAISQYIQRPKMIQVCINRERKHPFDKEAWIAGSPGRFDWSELSIKFERKLPGGYTEPAFKPRRNPSAMRWCHIDTSLSGDSSGFGVGHVERWVEVVRTDAEGYKSTDVAPYYVIDFMLKINPPPAEQIYMPDLRTMLYQFIDHGYRFLGFSCDAFQCLNEDTDVLTSRGILPIKDVQVGDTVASRSGPNRVLNKWCFGERDTLIVETRDGVVIEGTGKHRVEVLRGWHRKNKTKEDVFYEYDQYNGLMGVPVWEWKCLKDLKHDDVIRVSDWDHGITGQYVALKTVENLGPGGRGKGSMVDLPQFLTEDLAEWVGALWGDGDIGRDGVRFSCHVDEVHKCVDLYVNAFGVEPSVWCDENRATVRISSRRLVRWLRKNHLDKPKPLRVPDVVKRSPGSVQLAFLRGLFGADGSVNDRDGAVYLSTVSKGLAMDVLIMLRMSFGICSRITVVRRGRSGDYKQEGEQYHLGIRGSRKKFLDNIGFSVLSKKMRLRKNANIKGRRIYDKVKSIKNGRSIVYDIEVENDPSYMANGIVSHNSAEMLQQVKRRGIKSQLISVDRSTEPYDELKSAFYENRIEIYEYKPFIAEFKSLEYDRVMGKIDHPLAGEKDVSDGVAGLCWGLKNSAHRMPMEDVREAKAAISHDNAWVSNKIPADKVDPDAVRSAREGADPAVFVPMLFDGD